MQSAAASLTSSDGHLTVGSRTDRCDTKLGKGTLRISITAKNHAARRSCTEIIAKFHLQLDGQAESQQAGLLTGTLVDKTLMQDGGSEHLWVTELLQDFIGVGLPGLRTLYAPDGSPKQVDSDFAAQLKADKLMTINAFKLEEAFRNQGLGPVALNSFHEALGDLSDGYAFTGPIVLKPEAIDVADLHVKKVKDEYDKFLLGFYERSGYRTWHCTNPTSTWSDRVMGRTV